MKGYRSKTQCSKEAVFLKILTEVTCEKHRFCSWCPLFAIYSTIHKLVNSEGFVTFWKFIKTTFIFLNAFQAVVKQSIPFKENRYIFRKLSKCLTYIEKCKSIKTTLRQSHCVPRLQYWIHHSTEIENKTNHMIFPGLQHRTELKFSHLYFLYFTLTLYTLRLRILTGSSKIIALLHNMRTSHSEQPCTFLSVLLMLGKGLTGIIVLLWYIYHSQF